MNKDIHDLLKIQNDGTTIFTNKELKMIDDYIKELESYKYNMDRDYLRLEREIQKLENHQKIYIYYMNKTIEELECDDVDDEELRGYLIERRDTFKGILSKYKEIIGYVNE